MAKALFLSLPLHGHINPSLAVVRELVAQGEEVVYFSTHRYAAAIEQTGSRFRPYREPTLSNLSYLPEHTDELAWLLMDLANKVLKADLQAFRDERPDYLLTDSVAPWGQWAAKILDVPLVTSTSTFAFNRSVMTFGLAGGVRPKSFKLFVSKLRHMAKASRLRRRMCREYGVVGPGVFASVIGQSDLNIVYTSRQFQPCADTFDQRFQFVGPMTSRTETIAFPWERLDSADVVYVSLGTLFNRDPAFYRNCLTAFADQSVQVVLSIGTKVTAGSLGEIPANVVVATEVPQLAILQRAKAFVTHGGMNSVSESLANGVPMVVVPQMGEQAIVARRVEQMGAGIRLTPGEATPERLRDAVHQLLTDARFRRQADAIRRSFVDAGGATRAAEAISKFARGS